MCSTGKTHYLSLVTNNKISVSNLSVMPPAVLKKVNIKFYTAGCLGSHQYQENKFIKLMLESASCDLESMQNVLLQGGELSFEQIEALEKTWLYEKETFATRLYNRLKGGCFYDAENYFSSLFTLIREKPNKSVKPLIALLKREYGIVREIGDKHAYVGVLRKEKEEREFERLNKYFSELDINDSAPIQQKTSSAKCNVETEEKGIELPPYVRDSLLIPFFSMDDKNDCLDLIFSSTSLNEAEKVDQLLNLQKLTKADVSRLVAKLKREGFLLKEVVWDLVNGSDYKASITAYKRLYEEQEKVKAEVENIVSILKVVKKLVYLQPRNPVDFNSRIVKSEPLESKLHLVN